MNKNLITIVAAVAALISLFCAKRTPDDFWQSVLLHIFGTLLAVTIGLVIVNIFLENRARRDAVKSLLLLAADAIQDFHNGWLDLAWAKFGRDQYGDIGNEYMKSDGKPEALKKSVRSDLYGIVKGNALLLKHIEALDEAMTELSRMGGWSLDPSLLSHCLDARKSLGKLKRATFDDKDESIDYVAEHILDADIRSQMARTRLMELAGIK